MNLLFRFPRSWRTDVVVLRGGGRDAKGNPLPEAEIPRPGVLVGARSTAEPLGRSDVTDNKAVLYDGDTTFAYLSTDRVRVPAGSRMAGVWAVDGRPSEWPYGSEVGLKGS
jgi:hypothetical protein